MKKPLLVPPELLCGECLSYTLRNMVHGGVTYHCLKTGCSQKGVKFYVPYLEVYPAEVREELTET